MIEFRLTPHTDPKLGKVVECWEDGVFVATLYPQHQGVDVHSKYLVAVSHVSGNPLHGRIHFNIPKN